MNYEKYKIKKELPGLKIGAIINYSEINEEVFVGHNEIDGHLGKLIIDLINFNSGWVEEIKEPKNIYELKEGDKYYTVCEGAPSLKIENDSGVCAYESLLGVGEVFLTKQEAEQEFEKRKALAKIKKWIWKNNIELSKFGFSIFLSELNGKLFIDVFAFSSINGIYFQSNKDAEKCLEECKQEWKILFELI